MSENQEAISQISYTLKIIKQIMANHLFHSFFFFKKKGVPLLIYNVTRMHGTSSKINVDQDAKRVIANM